MPGVPEPPRPFDPLIETVEPSTMLYRVHTTVLESNLQNDGTVPNPGIGQRSRFGFFGDPVVPLLYAASSEEAAVHESLLHSLGPGTCIPLSQLQLKALTPLEVVQPLHLVSFRGAGLRRFGLHPRDLTDTDASQYQHTVKWAESAWKHGADGVVYMCRNFNQAASYCLFGTTSGQSLKAQQGWPPRHHFTLLQRDRDWLVEVAAAVGIHIDLTC